MNWRIYSTGHRLLSRLPGGGSAGYFLRRYLTKSLPVEEGAFRRRVEFAGRHLRAFQRFTPGGLDAGEAAVYEFGAGWDLLNALCFHRAGFDFQVVADVQPLLKRELVNDSLRRLRDHMRPEVGFALRDSARDRIPDGAAVSDSLRSDFGIRYVAPLDARESGLESESFDCITSTHTLEHVPRRDLLPLLKECRRLLRPGGLMSCLVDYRDHFSYGDRGLSPYHFLAYSESAWRRHNSRSCYQNRLRHRECLSLLLEAGFTIVSEKPQIPTERDLAELEAVSPAKEFAERFRPEELAVLESHIVAVK